MDEMLKEMAADSGNVEVEQTKVEQLAKQIENYRILEDILLNLEDRVSETKEKMKELSEKTIPDFFEAMGVDEIKLSDKSKVSIKRSYACGITAKNRSEAHKWLTDHGLGDIIKKAVTVESRGTDFDLVKDFLMEKNITHKESEKVHPQTLKAVVREQIENGKDIPYPVFSIYPILQTVIKKG